METVEPELRTEIRRAGSVAKAGAPEVMGLSGRRKPGTGNGSLAGTSMGGQPIFSMVSVVVAWRRSRPTPTMATAARVMRPKGPLANKPVFTTDDALLVPDWALA